MAFTYAGRYYEVVLDSNARLVKNTVVTVYESDGQTLATRYTDRTKATTTTATLRTDANGMLEFFAEPGEYELVVGTRRVTDTVYPDGDEFVKTDTLDDVVQTLKNGTLFYVSEYASDKEAFDAAVTNGGGIVMYPKGTPSITAKKRLPANFAGTITLRGQGKLATRPILSSTAKTFGAGIQGLVGFCWIPADANATADDFTITRVHVFAGNVSGLKARCRNGNGGSVNWYATGLGQVSTGIRTPSFVEVSDIDFGSLTNGSTIALTNGGDSTTKERFSSRNFTLPTATAVGTITVPASTVALVNQDGYAIQVLWYGGTVTGVQVSNDFGTTFTTINSGSPGSVILQPGDQIKWTYSSAPTARKVPVR